MTDLIRVPTGRPQTMPRVPRQTGGHIKFAYLSPDFANPTGLSVDLAERRRLLERWLKNLIAPS